MKTYLEIVILTHSRQHLLELCLGSLAQLERPLNLRIKISVILNGQDQVSRQVIEKMRGVLPEVNIIQVPSQNLGQARNQALQSSETDWVLFLDDDVQVERSLLSKFSRLLSENPDVAIFGGPNFTPPSSSRFQKLQGQVLGNYFGAGIFAARYKSSYAHKTHHTWGLTLCNLFAKKSELGAFSTDLEGGEETDLLMSMRRKGSLFYYSPELHVFHERRGNWTGFATQISKYGMGRAQAIKASFGSTNSLIGGILLSLLGGFFFLGCWRTLITFYLGMIFLQGAFVAKGKLRDIFTCVGLFFVLHVSYVFGLLKEFCHLSKPQNVGPQFKLSALDLD